MNTISKVSYISQLKLLLNYIIHSLHVISLLFSTLKTWKIYYEYILNHKEMLLCRMQHYWFDCKTRNLFPFSGIYKLASYCASEMWFKCNSMHMSTQCFFGDSVYISRKFIDMFNKTLLSQAKRKLKSFDLNQHCG